MRPQNSHAYRRNATRAGDSVVAHEQSISERHQAHQLRRFRNKLLRTIVIIVTVCVLLLIFMSQYSARLTVRVSGLPQQNETLSAEYEKLVLSYMSSRPAEHFRFLLHQDSLASYMQQDAPEVATIRVAGGEGADVLGTSTVYITLREPAVVWQPQQGKAWYVDRKGVLFQRNGSGKKPQVTIVDNSGIPAQQGDVIVSQRFLGIIGEMVGQLETYSLHVTQVAIPQGKTREIHITLKDVPYYIKATTTRSSADQAEDVSRVVRYMKKQGRKPVYIDVRTEGKAYYK